MPDQNVQSWYPFSDWNGPITLPFEAVHTYMAFKREFNPWGFLPLDLFQLQNITRKLWLPAVLELRPLISLLQPILLGSLPPLHSYPSCCLSFWAPYPPFTHIPPAAYPSVLPIPPTHIPPAAYPSELANPRPLPPMNALQESITEILQCP